MELKYGLTWDELQGYAHDLWEEARRVSNRANRDTIDNLIDSGRANANDTVFVEKAASPEEWDSIFRGGIGTLLSTGEHNRHVVAWFAKRGIAA